jgi:uncharacterized protein YjbJ (UPF0337 family)
MNKERFKGRVAEIKGKVKEMTGKLIKNAELEKQGQLEKTEGKHHEHIADLKVGLKQTD